MSSISEVSSISEDDKKRIMRACNSLDYYGKKHVNFTNKTIVLLNDSRDFRDDNGNTILHLLLKNGYFDVDILNGLLANGHNINAINNQGLTPMGQMDLTKYNFMQKINWCMQNGTLYMVAKKDENGNLVNNIEESTKIFLELVVFCLSYLMCNIEDFKQHAVDPENFNHYEAKVIERNEIIRTGFNDFIKLLKNLIDKKMILNDLTQDNELIYYNPIMVLMPVEYIKQIETVIKLNWDVDEMSQSGLIALITKREKKYTIPHNEGLNVSDHCDHNNVIPLCQYIEQKATNPKKFFTMLATMTGLTKIKYETSYLNLCKRYDEWKNIKMFRDDLGNLQKSMDRCKKNIDILGEVNSFSAEVYSKIT
jgi:hypothetical protein